MSQSTPKPFLVVPYSYVVTGELKFQNAYALATWVNSMLRYRNYVFLTSPDTCETPLQQEAREFLSVFAPLWEENKEDGLHFMEDKDSSERALAFGILFPLEWQERVAATMAKTINHTSEVKRGMLVHAVRPHQHAELHALDSLLVEFNREKNFMAKVAAASVRVAVEDDLERQRKARLAKKTVPAEVQSAIDVLTAAGYMVTPNT